MTQQTALDILKLGHNVYLTGAAGSGKTYILNEYIRYLKTRGVEVGVTASTGIAATHMGGVTIHSWTGFGIKDKLTTSDIDKLMEKSYLCKRMEKVRVLIIDEVSMLHHFRIDMVDKLLRAFKHNDLPFGGIQVVLCGDFFQLPPISRAGEPPARFVYHSDVWRVAKFKICYLEEHHRQTDDVSLRILNDIRNNEVSEDTLEKLQKRMKPGVKSSLNVGGEYNQAAGSDDFEDEINIDESTDADFDGERANKNSKKGKKSKDGAADLVAEAAKIKVEPTRLFTHNADVDALNEEALDRITGDDVLYYMESSGSDPLVELLKKSCLAPEELRLRIGARVMFVKNNFEAGYVNGTLGVVAACDDNGPIVKTFNGMLINVVTATWTIEEEGKIKAQISQYPLRLAWAITIHKSQGMSLDAVEVDLSKSFEKGMGYVALSRVRSIEGLTILGINDMALRVHDEVLMVDEKLRASSNRASDEILIMDEEDKERKIKLQKEYIDKIAPSESERKNAEAKKNKISTFDQTRVLIEEGKSLSLIAKERGLNEETIIDHIEKIVEIDPLFVEIAAYLKNYLPSKKQQLIREAFVKANPDLAKKAGEPGSRDYDGSVFKKVSLAPVKHKAGSTASYKDIRLIRILG